MIKKLFLFVSLLFTFTFVSAEGVSLDRMVEVINDGVITDEYLDMKSHEVDSDTSRRKWKNVVLKADHTEDTLTVSVQFEDFDGIYAKGFTAYLVDGNLKSEINFTSKDLEEKNFDDEVELHNLLPYWEIEASSGFSEVKNYLKSGYIKKLDEIFDKCYKEEMHLCRTHIDSIGSYSYISEVEMNDEATNYLLKVLKKEAKAEKNNKLTLFVVLVGIVILFVFLILKLKEPKPKALKY